jgi:alpha-amylase/alpha-mannosidase (GH57 family)
MDPDWLARGARLRALVQKGRDYSEEDKRQLRDAELDILRAVIPAYRSAAATGRIELTTSPFYHPILPLLCDTDTHLRAHPHSALPRRLFSYPDDAREQLARAFHYHAQTFGAPPQGVWPSEGAVSDEALDLLASSGAEWTATDEEILSRSLGRPLTAADLYRPYEVGSNKTRVLFRDHHLSDLIGFAYQSWDADAAVADFLAKVRDAGRRFAREGGGGDAVVTVILDGENAWEHYEGGGRPFLRTLYRQLSDASDIETVTMSEAASTTVGRLPSIFPGSWINGDFYIWAGHRDDHRAWAQLAAARRAFEHAGNQLTAESRAKALQELLIAEGSDWFWWYGEDHSSNHDRDFDDLFRRHVRNVYGAIGQQPPDDLYVSNITTEAPTLGPFSFGVLTTPLMNGQDADFVSWAAAVEVPLGADGGTMHRVTGHLVRRLEVAADREHLFLRAEGSELVRRFQAGEVRLGVYQDKPMPKRVEPEWVAGQVLTGRVAFAALELAPGHRASLSILVTDAEGRVLEQHPAGRPFEVSVPSADHDAVTWLV